MCKIPRAACNIYDKSLNKLVPATFYELDCKDKSDIEFIRNIEEKWFFQKTFEAQMNQKYQIYANCDNPSYRSFESFCTNNKFYSLETSDGDIACICNTDSDKNDVDISLIQSAPSKKFKYAASATMAAIAKSLAGTGKQLTVKAPLTDVRSFYSKGCGFKIYVDKYFRGFVLPQSDIGKFVSSVEEKTSGKIINYSC